MAMSRSHRLGPMLVLVVAWELDAYGLHDS